MIRLADTVATSRSKSVRRSVQRLTSSSRVIDDSPEATAKLHGRRHGGHIDTLRPSSNGAKCAGLDSRPARSRCIAPRGGEDNWLGTRRERSTPVGAVSQLR